MNANNFVQTSVTIKKGQSITLVDDSIVPHTLANGTWDHGAAHAAREAGAPALADVSVAGNSSSNIGPFTTAGTFQVYCTIHPGMNLTVIVQ